MKILHVAQAYYPFQEKGGPVFKVRALAGGLARRGHHVSVLTADLGLKKYSEIQKKMARCEFGWRFELDGVEVIYLPTLAKYRALTVNLQAIGFCKKYLPQFDVVHCYGLYDLLGPTIGYFCRRRGIPYIAEPMGMYRPIDRNLQLKRLWHRTLGKTFLDGAAKIIATSELEEQELVGGGLPSSKVAMRYNGVDSDLPATLPMRGKFRSKWRVPPDELLVLFISRLIPRKGADLLIAAFAKVCKKKGWLVVAGPEGEAGYKAYLEKSAAKSGLAERIIFCGPLYDDEKKAALADADIFVLASRYENFANVAAEAIACGIPVIVSNACGISSLVEGQAGLVIAPREDALIEALRQLTRDENLYDQLTEGCRRVADQLNWDTLTEQMEMYYREATSSSSGTAAR